MEEETKEEETVEETEKPEVVEEAVEEVAQEEKATEEPKEEAVEEKAAEETGFERKMYKATCADCKKECEVPFKPTEGRPVYCRDCYRKHRPQRRERRF